LKTTVKKGTLLFTIYSETEGELKYATEYLNTESDIILIE
jgi:thymidine phosphorylase